MLVLAGGVASADTTCTAANTITSANPLPFTIKKSGVWCLGASRNWSGAAPNTAAITIAASDVILDLNGFKLIGSNAGIGTEADGVAASNQRNITVRNGSIRGFYIAVQLDDHSGAGTIGGRYTLEDLFVSDSTYEGINLAGSDVVVRRVHISAVGGSTAVSNSNAHGIRFYPGSNALIVDNVVREVHPVGVGQGVGIYVDGFNDVVDNNTVQNAAPIVGNTVGIALGGAVDVAFFVNNKGNGWGTCINASVGKNGRYRDNLTFVCTTPYDVPASFIDEGSNN